MKELLKSLPLLLGAIILTSIIIPMGLIYSFLYSIWLTITLKKWYAIFLFWWRLIDGFAAACGHILYNISYALDLMWNVNGEIIEDIITTEDHTTFTDKNITVSSSVGKLEIDNKLNNNGKKISKLLSFVFRQKNHAMDSWNFTQARSNLESQFFKRK